MGAGNGGSTTDSVGLYTPAEGSPDRRMGCGVARGEIESQVNPRFDAQMQAVASRRRDYYVQRHPIIHGDDSVQTCIHMTGAPVRIRITWMSRADRLYFCTKWTAQDLGPPRFFAATITLKLKLSIFFR